MGQAEGCTDALQATGAGGGTRLVHQLLACGRAAMRPAVNRCPRRFDPSRASQFVPLSSTG